MVQRGSGDRHQSTIGLDQAVPVSNAKNNNNTNSLFITVYQLEFLEWAQGRATLGLF